MMVQHALQRSDSGLQKWYTENALIPGRGLESLASLGTVSPGETQGQTMLFAAEEAHAKTAVGEDRAMCFRARIDPDQQAGRVHAERCDGADRQPASACIRLGRHDRNAARQILHGLAKLRRFDGAEVGHLRW